MPKISALIHICNDARRLGRSLDSLRTCDDVMVVDHGSTDESLKIARDYGARIIKGVRGVDHGAYAQDARHDWIFCLLPGESLAEELGASLLEWKESQPPEDQIGYNVNIREQNGTGWKMLAAQLRLANRKRINWTGDLPPEAVNAPLIEGYILRISS